MSRDPHAVIIHRLAPKTNYTRQLNDGFKEIGHQTSITLYGWKDETLNDLTNGKRVWTPWLYPFQIYRALVADKPSIAHLQYEFTTFGPLQTNILMPLLLLLVKLTRTRLVITIHSVIPYDIVNRSFIRNFAPTLVNVPLISPAIKMFLILLYRLLNRSAEVVYVHGGWYRRALIVYYGAKAAKIKVVPYGVDADDKVDNATQEHYSKLLGHRKSVLCFGSVSPRKDIEGLIRAFGIFSQSHPDYVLVIAGNETLDFRWYGEHLKKVVNKLGLADDVLFLGFVSDSAVHALYRLSHFLVLPYVYAFEGPSGPLAFAVQHGLPVIGTDVGHLREEVHNLADGLLVPLDNPVALSQAMTTLADNLQLRERLAKNIIKKRIGASWRDVAAETYLGYKRMLELDRRT